MSSSFWSVALLAVIFVAGFCWGQWWAERVIRKEQAALIHDRVSISMPMRNEQSSKMLGLLRDLMEQVELDKKQGDGQ